MSSEFDYYIFIDFSENLIGYNIIEKSKVGPLLPKIVKLRHYKKLKHKKEYLNSMIKLFKRERISSFILKMKIFKMKDNIDLFSDVLAFIRRHDNCVIFISVDDYQFRAFQKLVQILDDNRTKIVKESQLKEGSSEYKMSLIIDTQLNLIRTRR